MKGKTNNLERRYAPIALEFSRYNLDIVTLSETRLADDNHWTELNSCYNFMWKGNETKEARIGRVRFAIKTSSHNVGSLPQGMKADWWQWAFPRLRSCMQLSSVPLLTRWQIQMRSRTHSSLTLWNSSYEQIFLGDRFAGAGSIHEPGEEPLTLQTCAEHGLSNMNTNFRLPLGNRKS